MLVESLHVQGISINGSVEAARKMEDIGMNREKPRPSNLMESKVKEGYKKEMWL